MDDICLSCGAKGLLPIVDFGQMPLANGLLSDFKAASDEQRFRLAVSFCSACAMVQITDIVPPERLFSDYVYFSSFSDTAVDSAGRLASRLIEERRLGPNSLVIEAASNDGYLLRHYRDRNIPVLGIEPAANIAREAERNGIPTRVSFFGAEEAVALVSESLRADIFHANNVLAHVPDINGFVAGIATVLAPDGIAIVEAPYLGDLIQHCEFDTIYHEHVFYFSLTALTPMLARHGLKLSAVERIPIHGGSVRLFIEPARGDLTPGPSAAALLDEERALGMDKVAYYTDFADRIGMIKAKLVSLLSELKNEGKRIAAYGASAKGATLLNAFGIGHQFIDYVVDRSTVKQGLLTPGTHMPIRSPAVLAEDAPDYVLLLTWNFADEILAQQSDYRAKGGRFIIPIPDVRVIAP